MKKSIRIPKPKFFSSIILFLVSALGIWAIFWILSWSMRATDAQQIPDYSSEEIAAAQKSRDIHFDPHGTLPTPYREVDYADGKKAAWYPKNEAPVLRELVAAGELPPVAERVGPEPLVLSGCEGVGAYGGTWMRLAISHGDIGIIGNRLSSSSPVSWSPLGHPVFPKVARKIDISTDKRTFRYTLRKGMKWSDGQPFTADDIIYWWKDEILNASTGNVIPPWMKIAGQAGDIRKISTHIFEIHFPLSNALFSEQLAFHGTELTNSPAHYLRAYHPEFGDSALCAEAMTVYKMASRRALYKFMKLWQNPEQPHIWPWIYRDYRSVSPQVFVRNPYYWAVDTLGNQLPYIDRIQFEVQSDKMIPVSAANGMVSMQGRHIRYQNYTELLSRQQEKNYRVLHWYPATRSTYLISPNMNRLVKPDEPETRRKAELLANDKFRKALSLAINRQAICQAEYNNQTFPAQVGPGPESPFYNARLLSAFVAYQPDTAAQMLDELGLNQRDREGFRTFPDGSRMTFFLDFCGFTGEGPGQFVVDDWAKPEIGIRLIMKERSRPLFYTRKSARDFDFTVWSGGTEHFVTLSPRYFIPYNGESNYAIGWGRWHDFGGYWGNPRAELGDCFPPPADHPMYRAISLYEEACQATTVNEQKILINEVLEIAAENLWTINLTSPPPQLMVVDNNLRNVPGNALQSYYFNTPANTGIETYFFTENTNSAGADAEIRHAILDVTPRPGAEEVADNVAGTATGWKTLISWVLRILIWGGLLFLGVAIFIRQPYIARRLLIMIPTLLIISIIIFTIIQMPPGDYLTTRIMQLQESGDEVDEAEIEDLKTLFHFEDSFFQQYTRWIGFTWFTTFDNRDAGLLQGNLGRSMETTQQVNNIVGDRILLTIFISLATILFTWALAIPIGIYSAVRQYSLGDYVLTFVGFIGMCVPPFLLALVLMSLADVSGLFSAEFAAQPEWSWGKVIDLLKHIWIPVVVLGVGGTAGMIRVMRANLIDELKKPYVITAMAKGVRPIKLLFKYPVRLALNPFISGIGGLFPQLVSGGAIVAMVLSLPTVGPLMLNALFTEDIYLAGSLLMILSILGVFGTLVSDLLLLWLDPRIRFKGGAK